MNWAVIVLALMSFGVQRVLNNAIIGERTAIARYEAFAAKADEEGFTGVADLFRAAAKAESIHLRRFTALMKERNLPLPAEEAVKVDVGSTRDNLQAAIAAENGERDGAYLHAIQTANDENEPAIAKVFDETRDAEVEHANLCRDAYRNINDMKVSREFYICDHCGYTSNVRLPLCPSCRDKHALH